MISNLLICVVAVGIPMFLVVGMYASVRRNRRETIVIDEKELQAAELALKQAGEQDWVVLKRCSGPAYNHAAMTEIISQLNALDVTATYDVVSSSSADGGVTNYMLKVLRGDEEKSREILGRHLKLL